MVIYLYVDDMLIIGAHLEIVKSTKKFLLAEFSVNDLRVANVILEVKILHKRKKIGLSQSHYIENMLKKYGYFDLPELFVPYDYN